MSEEMSVDSRPGFNAAFLSGHRSERIFAYHLAKLGIGRVLDIGANTGQFAASLRRFGFQGTIFSVEPQRAAYATLLDNSRDDARWVPLARQGAGAHGHFLDLNIAENSWSSSFRNVHANHLRAEQTTRTVGQERVYVNCAGNLMQPEWMAGVEALKIDVQGYEDQVLEGYRPWLPTIRLLLIELSMVECYDGGPDMFELDRQLVNEFGFSRVSLEPSYYDEVTGTVQQYDGIYFRPEAPSRQESPVMPPRLGAIVTSDGGPISRFREDGLPIGESWRSNCRVSWQNFGARVVSVAEVPPPDGLDWVRTEDRPTLVQILGASPIGQDESLLLVNADIDLSPSFHAVMPKLDSQLVYYGQRLDVEMRADGTYAAKGAYEWGFDYFIIPRAVRNRIVDESMMPACFRIGEPWWDYALVVIATTWGFPTKRLPVHAGALHLFHQVNYNHELWLSNGVHFLQLIERLAKSDSGYAAVMLEHIMAKGSELEARLQEASRLICQGDKLA